MARLARRMALAGALLALGGCGSASPPIADCSHDGGIAGRPQVSSVIVVTCRDGKVFRDG